MNQVNRVFEEVVASLKEDSTVDAVSIIGSGAAHYKELDKVVDIDLLILLNTPGHESREVKYISGKEYDFTYLSTDLLRKALDENSHIWLNLLSHAKHVYKRNDGIEELLKSANRIYMDGPQKISEQRIAYIRFTLTKKLEDLSYRKDKTVTFQYLAGVFLKYLTEAYFRLQNTWVPRDKSMMKVVFERDMLLFELIKAAFKAEDSETHYKIISDIVDYVLKPYGGKLTTLERQNMAMEE